MLRRGRGAAAAAAAAPELDAWYATDNCAAATSSSGAAGSDGSHVLLHPFQQSSGDPAADSPWAPSPFCDALSEGDAASARLSGGGFCDQYGGEEDGQLAAAQLFFDWGGGVLS